MTTSDESQCQQLTTRIELPLYERVEAFAEESDTETSELVQNALRDYLPDEGLCGPSEKKLREPYLWLRENTDDRGKIRVELALTELAQELGKSKELVKETHIMPLERSGWIKPDFGTIRLLDPDGRDN